MNTYVYDVVALVLQSAQAHNITVPGGDKYSVPPENITDSISSIVSDSGTVSNLTVYSITAIIGADDFRDNQKTIEEVFDIIVQTTREITPTCMFATIGSYPFDSLTTFSESSRNRVVYWVRAEGIDF